MLDANVEQPLTTAFNKDYEIRRVEVVGSKVGMQISSVKRFLRSFFPGLPCSFMLAGALNSGMAVGGILALVHDVIIINWDSFHYEYGIYHIHSGGTDSSLSVFPLMIPLLCWIESGKM